MSLVSPWRNRRRWYRLIILINMRYKKIHLCICCWSAQPAPSSKASANIWFFKAKEHISNSTFPVFFIFFLFFLDSASKKIWDQGCSWIRYFLLCSQICLCPSWFLSASDNLIITVPLLPPHPFLHTVALCHVFCNLGQPFCFSLQTP